MKKLLKSYICGKKVAILGFGREGQSTLKKLLEAGGFEKLDILDLNDIKYEMVDKILKKLYDTNALEQVSGKENDNKSIGLICGKSYQEKLDDYDVVIKSPGIVLDRNIEEYTCNITSQTEIFFEKYKNQIIGITGTKGKSTTTTLIYHILKNAGYDTVLAGNIGIPAFDIEEEINENTIIVFEMSSHMLEYMKVSPHIGVLMNIFEEHLDHYKTMEKYITAKKNIYLNQKQDDICFINSQIEEKSVSKHIPVFFDTLSEECKAKECKESDYEAIDGDLLLIKHKHIEFKYEQKPYEYDIPVENIKLVGKHNYFDIAVAYGVLKYIGVEDADFEKGLISYEPLPHRLQPIGIINGVKYYDDSISTICDTTINALNSVKDAATVLIGGMDRGIDYSRLIMYLSESTVENIILMYETGERIYSEIKHKFPEFKNIERIIRTENLEEAVKIAIKVTKQGKSCILSPAAASYGYFKNFEERGNRFSQLVNLYKK